MFAASSEADRSESYFRALARRRTFWTSPFIVAPSVPPNLPSARMKDDITSCRSARFGTPRSASYCGSSSVVVRPSDSVTCGYGNSALIRTSKTFDPVPAAGPASASRRSPAASSVCGAMRSMFARLNRYTARRGSVCRNRSSVERSICRISGWMNARALPNDAKSCRISWRMP